MSEKAKLDEWRVNDRKYMRERVRDFGEWMNLREKN